MTMIANTAWIMSIQGGALIVIVLAIRKLLEIRHIPKRYSRLLWALVAIRLLCPLWIESDFRGLSAIHTIEKEAVDLVSNSEIFFPELQNDEATEIKEETSTSVESLFPTDHFSSGDSRNRSNLLTQALNIPINFGLSVIYISGTLTVATIYVIQYIALKRRIFTAVKESNGVWLSEHIASPFVIGVFRSKIYLPYNLNEDEKRQIMLHERIHIAHHDPLIHLIGIICLCVHWWNPLVWLAARCMNADIEMSCDESVVKGSSREQQTSYAKLLLSFAIKQSNLTPGVYFGRSNTERRIANILDKKCEKRFLVHLTILITAICLCALMTAPVRSTVYASDITRDNSSSDGMPSGSISIEGTWNTTGIYYSSQISSLSKEDILSYLDVSLAYTADCLQGSYTEIISCADLQESYKISPDLLGLLDGSVLYLCSGLDESNDSEFGKYIFLTNENTGYIYLDGVFFEATKNAK